MSDDRILAELVTRILDARLAQGGRIAIDDVVAEIEAEIAPEFPPEFETTGRQAVRDGVRAIVRRVVEPAKTDPAAIAEHIKDIDRYVDSKWPKVRPFGRRSR
jgi:hypothetical protein